MKMKWKKGQAAKSWTCVLCGETIPRRYWFIRPHHRGGPDLDSPMVAGRSVTFNQKTPCFHLDCLETLGSWLGSIRPIFDNIYDNTGKIRLPLQDGTKHLPNGQP